VAGEPITVVLVEDNDVFRESLELLLGTVPDLQVVAAVPDGLPELDGVETTAAIGEAHPTTAVVVLTATAESEEIDALYDAGAVACLTKDRELDEIVRAVRDAAGRGAALR
jgi:DNA-binding NarL/FixJ family response regulator